MAKLRFIILFTFVFSFHYSIAQCFTSPGNPIGGTANMGTLQKGIFRITVFHKYNYADKYLNGHSTSEVIYYKNANYNYTGSVIGYGITDKFNLEAEAGFFLNKTVTFQTNAALQSLSGKSFTGNGLSNGIITAKYQIYNNNDKRFEWTMACGLKFPFSLYPATLNGVPLMDDIQPSTNSFGLVLQNYLVKENSFTGLRFFLLSRYETNIKNSTDDKYGDTYMNSIFISKHLWFPWTKGDGAWTAILQLRNELRGKMIENIDTPNERVKAASGGYMFFAGPQLNCTIHKTWNISLLWDIPVYQYYNEDQLSNKISFLINITKDIIANNKNLKAIY